MEENNLFDWICLDNLIFGFNSKFFNSINKTKISNIYLFDLDYTLIKTKSGKRFPIDKNDWAYLYENIPAQLNKYNNSIIGIITNQKGLKNKKLVDDWIFKMNNIVLNTNINFVFASLKDDRYRKPLIGSWEYIKEQFLDINSINIDHLILTNKIYWIGDAFGRTTDFSDSDIKYGINCKFKFKTPEIFFKIKKNSVNGTITYPIINYYSRLEQDNIFSQIDNLIKSNNKILIMTIGFPASGKSFLRKELLKKYNDFKYINNDDIKSKESYDNLIKNNFDKYNKIIDDNTNLNFDNRIKQLNKFPTHYKIGIFFDYSIETTLHLDYLRMFWFNHKLLSKIIFRTLAKSFDKTKVITGFDHFIIINRIFYQFNFDDKIKYYY